MKPGSIINFVCRAVILCLSSGIHAAATPDQTKVTGACPPAENAPLAFWLGHWDAFADAKLDGRSFVESTLAGCAVLEHWDDVSGMKGMSLFYFEPHGRQWKQVWVTDHAVAPGGLKEKTLIFSSRDTVRFQGSVWVADDRMVLDRTTLHKLDDGTVSQLIEYSKDGGTTWIKSYAATYRRPTTDHP